MCFWGMWCTNKPPLKRRNRLGIYQSCNSIYLYIQAGSCYALIAACSSLRFCVGCSLSSAGPFFCSLLTCYRTRSFFLIFNSESAHPGLAVILFLLRSLLQGGCLMSNSRIVNFLLNSLWFNVIEYIIG